MWHNTKNSALQCVGSVTENNFFLHLVVMYIWKKKKKLKYKLQRCIMNIPKFQKIISFTELITNFIKSHFFL